MQQFTGIFIEEHKTIDAKSKAKATQTLTGWQMGTFTPEKWIEKLERGQTISLCAFAPTSQTERLPMR